MTVSYVPCLKRSWERSRRMLLKPFRIETWLVLGFAAFLSEWLSGGWSNLMSGRGGGGPRMQYHLDRLEWFRELLVWGPLVAMVLLAALVVALVFQWLGARGKFVFLDGVLHERAAIVEPWKRFARLGNSLFLWKLGFWVVTGIVVGGVVVSMIGTGVLAFLGLRTPVAVAPPLALGVLLAMSLGVIFAFVLLMVDDFVVPLMHRHSIGVLEAWRRFLPLLRQELGAFVLYALFVLLLYMGMVVIVAAIGFATCCVGFLLTLAPYVGQVVLLPIYTTFRGLGPEFLAQFGTDFDVRPAAADTGSPAATAEPPAPPPGGGA
jgi:hypothetical protein